MSHLPPVSNSTTPMLSLSSWPQTVFGFHGCSVVSGKISRPRVHPTLSASVFVQISSEALGLLLHFLRIRPWACHTASLETLANRTTGGTSTTSYICHRPPHSHPEQVLMGPEEELKPAGISRGVQQPGALLRTQPGHACLLV